MQDDSEDPIYEPTDVLQMTADIVASFVSNNIVAVDQLPDLIKSVHAAIGGIASGAQDRPLDKPKPATPVSKSIHEDYIVCLEDGKKLKMLKRYLRSNYDLSPDEYRKRWGLPPDYPMVAPNYARRRSDFAKEIGLGRGVRRKA
jgi:predicted transcriptional regulator